MIPDTLIKLAKLGRLNRRDAAHGWVLFLISLRTHAFFVSLDTKLQPTEAGDWLELMFNAAAKGIDKPLDTEWNVAEMCVVTRIALADCGQMIEQYHPAEHAIGRSLAAIQGFADNATNN